MSETAIKLSIIRSTLLCVTTLAVLLFNSVQTFGINSDGFNDDVFRLSEKNVVKRDTTKIDKGNSCLNEQRKPGECVPYYFCGKNGTIITNGVDLIDVRASTRNQRRRREISSNQRKREANDDDCESYLDICCLPPTAAIVELEKLPSEQQEKVVNLPVPGKPKSINCGYRNPNGIPNAESGNENQAKFGEFNWMVSILRREVSKDTELKVYQCGGSLIHPSVVLTSASCVRLTPRNNEVPELKLIVRAGDWNTALANEALPHQDRDVVKVRVHPGYMYGILFNDAALLFLNSSVTTARNIGTICLPYQDELITPGTKCFASGWGKDVFGKNGHYQTILKKVELPIISNSNCQEKLRATRVGKHFLLDKSFMCAGGEKDKDMCHGDGGSPLVCPIKNATDRFVQVGTVAWGLGCGEPDIPGVYGNVAHFRKWIDETMLKEGFNIDSYTI